MLLSVLGRFLVASFNLLLCQLRCFVCLFKRLAGLGRIMAGQVLSFIGSITDALLSIRIRAADRFSSGGLVGLCLRHLVRRLKLFTDLLPCSLCFFRAACQCLLCGVGRCLLGVPECFLKRFRVVGLRGLPLLRCLFRQIAAGIGHLLLSGCGFQGRVGSSFSNFRGRAVGFLLSRFCIGDVMSQTHGFSGLWAAGCLVLHLHRLIDLFRSLGEPGESLGQRSLLFCQLAIERVLRFRQPLQLLITFGHQLFCRLAHVFAKLSRAFGKFASRTLGVRARVVRCRLGRLSWSLLCLLQLVGDGFGVVECLGELLGRLGRRFPHAFRDLASDLVDVRLFFRKTLCLFGTQAIRLARFRRVRCNPAFCRRRTLQRLRRPCQLSDLDRRLATFRIGQCCFRLGQSTLDRFLGTFRCLFDAVFLCVAALFENLSRLTHGIFSGSNSRLDCIGQFTILRHLAQFLRDLLLLRFRLRSIRLGCLRRILLFLLDRLQLVPRRLQVPDQVGVLVGALVRILHGRYLFEQFFQSRQVPQNFSLFA